ncbi:hypothetical protein D9M72_523430 [compost metagenome]
MREDDSDVPAPCVSHPVHGPRNLYRIQNLDGSGSAVLQRVASARPGAVAVPGTVDHHKLTLGTQVRQDAVERAGIDKQAVPQERRSARACPPHPEGPQEGLHHH